MLHDKSKILKGFFICSLLVAFGCSTSHEIKSFKSDGCTLFPDRSLISENDWCDCCFEHDIAYWQGGTEKERLEADIEFRKCIEEKTGNKTLAAMMYNGVRAGGSPSLNTWYRWGYGWDFGRKYRELTEEEKQDAERKLSEFFKNGENHPCKDD